MLAISQNVNPDTCDVNIVPCQIKHDGPTKLTKRYWSARVDNDGARTTYFRGRRLRGKAVKVPKKYRGLILKATNKTIIDTTFAVNEDEESELPDPVKIVDEVSTFEEMVIWGHDQIPAADDAFVKGIEEWTTFAEAIHAR